MLSAEAVLEALDLAAAMANAAGRVVRANAAWSAASQILPSVANAEITAPRVLALLRAGQRAEVELRRGTGAELRVFLVRVAPLDGDHLVTIEDRTVWRRAEDKLTASNSRLRSVIAGAPIVLLGLDPEGVFTLVEGMGGSGLGATPELLVGRSVFEAYAHLPSMLEAFGTARHGDEVTTRVEVGSMTFELQFSPRKDTRGEVVSITGVATDITERTRIEHMKNEFVSVVSHELRTPLTSIRGSLGLLEGGVVGQLPDKAGQLVSIARNNADRLIRLINDILDLDKLEAGRLEFRAEALESGPLLQDCVHALQGMAMEAGIEFVIDDAGVEVTGDPERLLQVLVNFASNAIKFSPADSKVTLAAARDGATARFEVRDEGPGIREEVRDRLFKKFQQLQSTLVRKSGGSGLGLAISKAIVEAHHGEIGVESVEGQGSTFFFTIAVRGTGADLAPRARASELRGRTVEIDVGQVRDPTRRPVGVQLHELIETLTDAGVDDTALLVDAHAQASVLRATIPPDVAAEVGEHVATAARALESLGLRASGDVADLQSALLALRSAAALTSSR